MNFRNIKTLTFRSATNPWSLAHELAYFVLYTLENLFFLTVYNVILLA